MRTELSPRFLAACRGEPTDAVPVWFMRQAGRSLPEYRALRARHPILELCRTPELAAEVTLQPVRRFGVDAAVLFSDIVVLLQAMGVRLDIVEGRGPVIAEPLRSATDVSRFGVPDVRSELADVLEAVRIVAAEAGVPVIGFAGAPFTLASYLIEGGPSKTHARTKAFMYSEPGAWHALLSSLAAAAAELLVAEVEAGAGAVQVFDSWAGFLAPADYEAYVLPHVRRIFDAVAPSGAVGIVFGVGTGELLGLLAASGADVIGVDWRVPLDAARARVGPRPALQGNLDPAACLAPPEVMDRLAADVLRRGGGRAHVFNLGHGVLPETNPDALARLVELVHSWSPDG